MILKSFKYSSGEWSLEGLDLTESNLIVGKNSSGKSKFLQALESVMEVLSQKRGVNSIYQFDVEILLEDEEDKISYSLSYARNGVVLESLLLNGRTIIRRDAFVSMINGEMVNPPADRLLLHVRRDVQKNPEIEKIIKWAEESVVKSFIDRSLLYQDEYHDLLAHFTREMKSHLVSMIRTVGFPVSKIDTLDNHINRGKSKKKSSEEDINRIPYIVLEEDNVGFLFHHQLSSGMFRTIMLLILIEQLISLKRPALLAIDDLGEGLDYTRATKVGALLFNVCKEYGIQLIATSNEEFMMNIVDISQWNILMRRGKVVRSLSSKMCQDEFEEFKFTGLSNYDFFTSDFLDKISDKLFKEV